MPPAYRQDQTYIIRSSNYVTGIKQDHTYILLEVATMSPAYRQDLAYIIRSNNYVTGIQTRPDVYYQK